MLKLTILFIWKQNMSRILIILAFLCLRVSLLPVNRRVIAKWFYLLFDLTALGTLLTSVLKINGLNLLSF